MNKYIKKPVEVEALQIHGNVSEIHVEQRWNWKAR